MQSFRTKRGARKYQGVSVVSLIVDAHGLPQRIRVVRKLGMGLDEKAVEAVKQYKFRPPRTRENRSRSRSLLK